MIKYYYYYVYSKQRILYTETDQINKYNTCSSPYSDVALYCESQITNVYFQVEVPCPDPNASLLTFIRNECILDIRKLLNYTIVLVHVQASASICVCVYVNGVLYNTLTGHSILYWYQVSMWSGRLWGMYNHCVQI